MSIQITKTKGKGINKIEIVHLGLTDKDLESVIMALHTEFNNPSGLSVTKWHEKRCERLWRDLIELRGVK